MTEPIFPSRATEASGVDERILLERVSDTARMLEALGTLLAKEQLQRNSSGAPQARASI